MGKGGLIMDQKKLRELENKCIQDQPPGCTAACPVHVDVRSFNKEIKAGNISAAFSHICQGGSLSKNRWPYMPPSLRKPM